MAENAIIRNATIEDLLDIQRLSQKLVEYEFYNCGNNVMNLDWSFSENGKDFFEREILYNVVIVAEINHKCVGYISGSINENEPWYNVQIAYIHNFFVEEEYRNIGIGKALNNEFKNRCLSANIHHIRVSTLSANNCALKFYSKRGFQLYVNQLIYIEQVMTNV